jgi:hypothetical protein
MAASRQDRVIVVFFGARPEVLDGPVGGVISGGTADNTWVLSFSLGATSVTGDTLNFQVVCANSPVGAAARVQASSSTSKPTLKIVTPPSPVTTGQHAGGSANDPPASLSRVPCRRFTSPQHFARRLVIAGV